MKYSHKKSQDKLAVDRKDKSATPRKVSSHKTVERVYGHFSGLFGGSLGSEYNKTTGKISKTHRADSIE
jgi:hypothetical protein